MALSLAQGKTLEDLVQVSATRNARLDFFELASGRGNRIALTFPAGLSADVARLKWRLPCRIKPPNQIVRRFPVDSSPNIHGSIKGN
jgi:hypothetical protein